ncbi:MAG TPA: alpha/beta hydrolase [Rubrivivax sp.]|jgi:alpha-beta hydrolase superfamily lysophospholipase|nr:lysophospholipase [Rhodoferax sp.]MCL4740510.1 alpha/beta hydrolase [Burkholderiaceae bacterium]MCP5290031.1 lysophospholipase [Burkholderiaceae bacterium]HMR70650.1 alpha/beta hydrolase [Rubrivivax sp.]
MAEDFVLQGHAGTIRARRWAIARPSWVALLCHGYGEHIGRYEHVAARLNAAGAVVFGQDHLGHGRSDGERVLCTDFEPVVDDMHRLAERARGEYPALPQVLIGHSMGGMLAARYLQRFGAELACAVLSAPLLTGGLVDALLAMEEIPDAPLDPNTLSRDPAVGAAYAADPLVYHGAFKRPTLEAFAAMLGTIRESGRLPVPVLWMHGTEDPLVSYDAVRQAWPGLRGDGAAEKAYAGAKHEIFNETNRDEVLDDLVGWVSAQV